MIEKLTGHCFLRTNLLGMLSDSSMKGVKLGVANPFTEMTLYSAQNFLLLGGLGLPENRLPHMDISGKRELLL